MKVNGGPHWGIGLYLEPHSGLRRLWTRWMWWLMYKLCIVFSWLQNMQHWTLCVANGIAAGQRSEYICHSVRRYSFPPIRKPSWALRQSVGAETDGNDAGVCLCPTASCCCCCLSQPIRWHFGGANAPRLTGAAAIDFIFWRSLLRDDFLMSADAMLWRLGEQDNV